MTESYRKIRANPWPPPAGSNSTVMAIGSEWVGWISASDIDPPQRGQSEAPASGEYHPWPPPDDVQEVLAFWRFDDDGDEGWEIESKGDGETWREWATARLRHGFRPVCWRQVPPVPDPIRAQTAVPGKARDVADALIELHTRCDDLRNRLERIEEEIDGQREADAQKTGRLRADVDRLLAMVPSAAPPLGTEAGS